MGRTAKSSRTTPSRSRRAVIALDLGGTKFGLRHLHRQGDRLAKTAVPLDGRQGAAVGKLIVRQIKRLFIAAAKRGLECKGRRRFGARHRASNWPRVGAEHSRLGGLPAAGRRSAPRLRMRKLRLWSKATAPRRFSAKRGRARPADAATRFSWRSARASARALWSMAASFAGLHGIAGAIGWLALDRPFRPEYEACGCFESHASGDGIAAVAKRCWRGARLTAATATEH